MTQANIESTRFTGPRQPAWQAFGAPLDPAQVAGSSDAELLADAGLDFAYHTFPLTYETPDGERHESSFAAIAREPYSRDAKWKEMGPVGPAYTYLQNDELLRGVRVLQKETGWELDSMGTLGRGDVVYMALRADERTIFGDHLQTYVILHDGKARRQALSIAVTPVRLYCMNQLQGGSFDMVRIPHKRTIAHEYGFWTRMLGKLQRQQHEVYQQLEAMGRVHITDAQARTIIERAYPMPRLSSRARGLLRISEVPGMTPEALAEIRESLRQTQSHSEQARDLIAARRQSAFTLYERFNDRAEQGEKTGGAVVTAETLATLVRTPYAVLQGITELVDWGGQAGAAVAAGSALFGEGSQVKTRAWKAALAASK